MQLWKIGPFGIKLQYMKKLAVFVFTIIMMVSVLPVFATGMPVIDISSITESITQFVTTVQQYNRQIQQWKSEYERLEKAAKQIAQGDYQSVISGLASITGQISKWNIGSTAQDVFNNFSNGVLNFDSFYKSASTLYSDMSAIARATSRILQNREKNGEGYSMLNNTLAGLVDLSNFATATVTRTAAVPLKALDTYENIQNILATLELLEKDDPLGKMDQQLEELQKKKTELVDNQKKALDEGNSTQAEQYALLAKEVDEKITNLAASRAEYKQTLDELHAQADSMQSQYYKEKNEQENAFSSYSTTLDTLSNLGSTIYSQTEPTFSFSDPSRSRSKKNVL